MKYPDKFQDLIDSFQRYPGIGPKTAERLAFYTISDKNKEQSEEFAKNIVEAINTVKHCKICGMLADKDVCDICSDENRENKLLIVEDTKDVTAFEKTNVYHGKYHILNSLISPTNGKGPDDIGLDSLLQRINTEKPTEVIIATSSNIDGELTAMYLSKILNKRNVKVYRIGYGLPVSANIEYVDEITLAKSLEGKKEM